MYAIGAEYHWVGMKNDVSYYVKTCEKCQQSKKRKCLPKPPLKPIVAHEPPERVEIDFTVYDYTDPDNGHIYILTVVDCCTKFMWAKTFISKHAAPVAQFLFDLFSSEGYPTIIQSDNGKEFIAEIIKEYIRLVNAKEVHSRAKHPQTNGQIERLNGTFKGMLRNLTAGKIGSAWSALVPVAVERYNSTMHSTIGCAPREVFRGITRHLKLESDGTIFTQIENYLPCNRRCRIAKTH